MKNKLLAILCMFVISIASHAINFKYEYYGVTFKCKVDKGVVCITDFNTDADKVVVPATVRYGGTSYAVKSVSTFSTGKYYKTTLLIIEEGIEEIDDYSFRNFRKLSTVSLPSTITIIGKKSFNDDVATFKLPSSISETALRNGDRIENNEISINEDYFLAQAEQARKKAEQGDNAVENESLLSQSPLIDKSRKGVVSSIDINIPSGDKINKDTYCLIIANEKYSEAPTVDFAENDGRVFQSYCIKTLGIPEKQIRAFYNASYTDMKRAFNWIENVANVTNGKAKIIVYYAGHGLPSEKDNSAYLMPSDCYPKDITTCFMLREIYQRMGSLKAQSVTMFLDACFSGMQRGEDKALVAARSVATRPREETLTGNVVVISAASNDETALAYNEQQHGLFTYYLLQKLKDTKGDVSLGELFLSISSEVQKSSLIENDKLQTPSVNASLAMKNKWMNINF